MVAPASRYHAYDAATVFTDGVTMTEDGVVKDAQGQDVVIDLGAGRNDVDLIIDLKAIHLSGVGLEYDLVVQASNSRGFAPTATQLIAHISFGGTGRRGGAKDTPLGIYQVPFNNADPEGEYRYVRLYLVISGTTTQGTITFAARISARLGNE